MKLFTKLRPQEIQTPTATMFDMPEAKRYAILATHDTNQTNSPNFRVRRSDLQTRSSSSHSPPPSEPDAELQAQLASQLAAIYGDFSFDAPAARAEKAAHITHEDEAQADDDQTAAAYEFRLFSTNPAAPAQKIVLAEEDNGDGEGGGGGGFVRRQRDKTYYFARRAEGERKAQFEFAAVSGETVLAWREKRAWGLEVPWRVRTIRVLPPAKKAKATSNGQSIPATDEQDAVVGEEVTVPEKKKKKKVGKKRRIMLREKARKREVAEAARRKAAELKEETEKEKRTRRNREKKVKRKLKEKAKKLGGDGGGPGNADSSDEAMGGSEG